MDKIKAITKRPGGKPVSTWITPSLENLQRYVGGYIEVVGLFPTGPDSHIVVICDEEGKPKGYDHNCYIEGHEFVGDIIICGTKDGEFVDLPLTWHKMKVLYPHLWKEGS